LPDFKRYATVKLAEFLRESRHGTRRRPCLGRKLPTIAKSGVRDRSLRFC
jgi:hypothetical protein